MCYEGPELSGPDQSLLQSLQSGGCYKLMKCWIFKDYRQLVKL